MAPKKAKIEKPKIAQDKETILRVEPYVHFGKHTLRPYVDDGMAIYLPKGIVSEKKFLTPSKILANLDANNSELCRRLQQGLSMKGSCVEELADFYENNKDDFVNALTGLTSVFAAPIGERFVDACKFFNQRNEQERNLDTARRHIGAVFELFEEQEESLAKVLRRAMMVASRTYLCAASMFELLALGSNLKEWAKRIEPRKLQSKAIRSWIDDPKNRRKAYTALALAITDTGKKKKKGAKTTLKDDDDDDDDNDDDDDDADADDVSSDKPKKKEKKGKTGGNKGKRKHDDSDSSSADDSDDSSKRRSKKKAKKAVVESSDDSADSSATASGKDDDKGKKKGAKVEKGAKHKGKPKDSARNSRGDDHKSSRAKSGSQGKDEKQTKSEKAPSLTIKAAPDDTDTQTAAYAGWSMGKATEFMSAAMELKGGIGNLAGGRVPVADLRKVWALLPEVIVESSADLKRRIESVAALDDVDNNTGRAIANCLVRMGATMETFFEEQTGIGAGGSLSQPSGATAAGSTAAASI